MPARKKTPDEQLAFGTPAATGAAAGRSTAAATTRLYLVDGSAYVYRAFHALPFLSTSRGVPTNAAYGFTTCC